MDEPVPLQRVECRFKELMVIMTGVFFSAVAAEADLHQAALDRMRLLL